MLAHLLRVPRLNLYLNFERELSGAELDSVRELVRRRGNREPLQLILGSTSFCALEIKVNREVLVPRPETELLAERAWTFLATLDSRPSTALDFGTGSGCIAIALAANCPTAQIHAVDLSAGALSVARENAVLNGVAERIEFQLGDGFAALPPGLSFDLIVANPPYIPSSEIDALAPEVRDYDPRAALDGGADGLEFFRRLATQAVGRLKAAGKIMLEFVDGQAERLREILVQHKWVVEAV